LGSSIGGEFNINFINLQFPLRLDYGRSPHAYVNQRLQIQLELLMMSGVPLETCSAFNERWNNKFCYKVASCWLFLLNHIEGEVKLHNLTTDPAIRLCLKSTKLPTTSVNVSAVQLNCNIYFPASGDSGIRVGGSPRQAINDDDDKNKNNNNNNNNKGPWGSKR